MWRVCGAVSRVRCGDVGAADVVVQCVVEGLVPVTSKCILLSCNVFGSGRSLRERPFHVERPAAQLDAQLLRGAFPARSIISFRILVCDC